jgi:Fic family protein
MVQGITLVELVQRSHALALEIESHLGQIPVQVRRALHALDIQSEEPDGREEQEEQKAEEVRCFLVSLGPHQLVTEALIKEVHRILTEGLGYYGNVPGEYRGEGEMELWGTYSGHHTAVDWREVPRLMAALVAWLESTLSLSKDHPKAPGF